LNKKNNTITNWHVTLVLTRGTMMPWHVDNILKLKN